MEQEMYTYFNAIEETHWWFQARKEIIKTLLNKYHKKNPEDHVLDVGCGTGMMAKELAEYGQVWGLDNDPSALEYSRKKAEGARFILGSLPDDMPARQFKLITLLDVLEHIENDTEALQKLEENLEPNGTLLITVPAYRFLWTSHDDINQHKRRYTIGELKEKIEGANLKIEKISYYNTFLFPPIVAAKKIINALYPHRKKSHFGIMSPSPLINAPLKPIFTLEKYFLPHINFPFGISIIAVASKKEL